jgi:hypothetical protein
VDYRDVLGSAAELDAMLAHSGGVRKVPVILEDGRAVIGYGGT